jgi:hypothetical protein
MTEKKKLTVNEVMKTLTDTEYLVIDYRELNAIIICDHVAFLEHGSQRIKRIYNFTDQSHEFVTEFDVAGAIDLVVDAAQDKVDMKLLIKEALLTQNPATIIEAAKRLKHPATRREVQSAPGCFSLRIPDPHGEEPPLELTFIE